MPTRADFQSGYASSGDARIYFEAAGVGPGLVFVHAGVSDSRMWEPQFDTFAAKYRVVRYDHRGFGKSKMPDGPYALRDDLLSVVRQVGIAKATFVGCSMGGATVIDFALEHPEMVSALVLVGSGVTGLNDPSQLSADSIKHWAEFLTAARDRDVDRARELEAKYWIDGPSRDAAQVDPVYRERARQLHRENFSLEHTGDAGAAAKAAGYRQAWRDYGAYSRRDRRSRRSRPREAGRSTRDGDTKREPRYNRERGASSEPRTSRPVQQDSE